MRYRFYSAMFSPVKAIENCKARVSRAGSLAVLLGAGLLGTMTLSGCKPKDEHNGAEEHAKDKHHGTEEHAKGEHHEEAEKEESQLVLTKPITRDTVISRD